MPAALLEHIGSGRPWEFDMADRSLRFMTPFVGVNETRWFHGTGDAIAQNLNLLDLSDVDTVLVLSAEHVYSMDYREVVDANRRSGADVTLAYVDIDPELQNPRFGNMVLDADGRVGQFIEKPPTPISPHVSIGIFCFKLKALMDLLTISKPIDPEEDFSLAGHVMQAHVGNVHAQSWRFEGDWHYLADLREYYDFHMRLAQGRIRLFDEKWNLMTNFSDRRLSWRPPLYCSSDAVVRNAIVSPGCHVEGEVVSAVLSPGARVGKGAIVRNSVLLHDVTVEEGCRVENAVIDKDAHLGKGSQVGIFDETGLASTSASPLDQFPLTVVPKNYCLRAGQHLRSGTDLESLVVH
jgi:glucose-1-phosphate adenylyltransferase